MQFPRSSQLHVIPYPFEMVPTIEGKISGGLPAVLAAEFDANRTALDRTLMLISTDESDLEYTENNASIAAAESSAVIPPFGEWFSHRWALLHPDAHTNRTLDDQVINEMYQGNYSTPAGSLEHVFEHCEYYPLIDKSNVEAFTQRFRSAFNRLLRVVQPENTIVNWQDPLFFAELQSEYAPLLKKVGIRQTSHVHTALPSSLYQSPWGSLMLDVLSQMDRVYVHTEGYRSALERQLENRGLQNPRIERFDLMIDIPLLRRISDQECGDLRNLPEYQELSSDQKTVIGEILRTNEGADAVPHRFLCLDRADPGKGVTVLIHAIERFLQTELDKGISHEELRKQYRFFMLHDQLPSHGKSFEKYNIKEQYAHVVLDRYKSLQQQYPGIIHCCKSVPKSVVIRLMDNCHALTASTQDGLNLAWPETVWTNVHRGRDRFGIMARGAGFAQEAVRRGVVQRPELFPHSGDVGGLACAIETLVNIERNNPGQLRHMGEKLVRDYIDLRTDSVIVDA